MMEINGDGDGRSDGSDSMVMVMVMAMAMVIYYQYYKRVYRLHDFTAITNMVQCCFVLLWSR